MQEDIVDILSYQVKELLDELAFRLKQQGRYLLKIMVFTICLLICVNVVSVR